MRYYIDACIWRDYFEDRKDNFRPLGEWALMLIKRIIDEGDFIIFSDLVYKELSNNYTSSQLMNLLSFIPHELRLNIYSNHLQSKEAFRIKTLLKIPFNDALHAVLAKNNDAILVTRDKHFYELQNKLTIKRPEDLI